MIFRAKSKICIFRPGLMYTCMCENVRFFSCDARNRGHSVDLDSVGKNAVAVLKIARSVQSASGSNRIAFLPACEAPEINRTRQCAIIMYVSSLNHINTRAREHRLLCSRGQVRCRIKLRHCSTYIHTYVYLLCDCFMIGCVCKRRLTHEACAATRHDATYIRHTQKVHTM